MRGPYWPAGNRRHRGALNRTAFRENPLHSRCELNGFTGQSRNNVHQSVSLLGFTVLKADIESQQLHFLGQALLAFANDRPDGALFLHVQVVEGAHVTLGDDHEMEARQRRDMRNGQREFIRQPAIVARNRTVRTIGEWHTSA